MQYKCFKIRLKKFPGKLNKMTQRWEKEKDKIEDQAGKFQDVNKCHYRKKMNEEKNQRNNTRKFPRNEEHEFSLNSAQSSMNHDI